MGQFGEEVRSIGLLASHKGFVKFRSAYERIYRNQVSTELKSLVHGALIQEKRKRKIMHHREVARLVRPPQENVSLFQDPPSDKTPLPAKEQMGLVKGGVDYSHHDLMFRLQSPIYTQAKMEWGRGGSVGVETQL
jgi:hypothetical protein